MFRNIIKFTYLTSVRILNKLIRAKIHTKDITIFMTFKEDIEPLIYQLKEKGYRIHLVVHPKWLNESKQYKVYEVISLQNKYIYQQIKAIKQSAYVIIDNYYLLLGGMSKHPHRICIQTWHAAGALKNFGLEDQSVNLKDKKVVENYLKVYNFTDYYLISSDTMGEIFQRSLRATPNQMLKFGLPRLDKYQYEKNDNTNMKNIILYAPTYRDYPTSNQIAIDKHDFKNHFPNSELIIKLHPSIQSEVSDERDIQTLLKLADVVITDYSSISIEAALLNKLVLFYPYDEERYDKERGLNAEYFDMTKVNKAVKVDDLYELIKHAKINTELKDKWHTYTQFNATDKVLEFIENRGENYES